MNFNRNKHCSFVQWLDRTAEKCPLLWFPCVLLIALALVGERIFEYARIAYRYRNTEKVIKDKPQVERKPFIMRAAAVTLAAVFSVMTVQQLGLIGIDVYADEIVNAEINELGNDDNSDFLQNEVTGENIDVLNDGTGEIPSEIEGDSIVSEDFSDSTMNELTNEASNDDDGVAVPESDEFEFIVVVGEGDPTLTISGYKGNNTEVIIPEKIGEMRVTEIGESAFENNIDITSVDIFGITSIGKNAFRGCTSLKNVYIKNAQRICENAFMSCTSISTVDLGEGVNYIDSGAFANCSSLTDLYIHNYYAVIGADIVTASPTLNIHGMSTSSAQTYAESNGINFISLNDIDITFAGGDGSEENPYLVATAEQLNAVRNDLSAHYKQIADIDLSVYASWVPIGAEVDKSEDNILKDPISFKGTYNGQNYKILNMTITSPNYKWVGLFGSLETGKDLPTLISNLKLENVNINLDMQSIDYENNGSDGHILSVGGIAGSATRYSSYYSKCSIINCEVTGSIKVVNCYDVYAGGIVGYGDVLNSVNKADIYIESNRTHRVWESRASCGGITGQTESVNGEITNCINFGNIDVTAGGFVYCGGICGEYGQISFSFNYGNIRGTTIKVGSSSSFASNTNVGGIVGATCSDNTHHVVNYGNIEANASRDENVYLGCLSSAGGIVGDIGYEGAGLVHDSYNLCEYIISREQGKIDGANAKRIGYRGSYGKLLENNYSIDTTFVNGLVPTENIGANEENGESLTREEIEARVAEIFNGISEYSISAKYLDKSTADLNNVNMNEALVDFSIKIPANYGESTLNGGVIYLRKYDDNSACKSITYTNNNFVESNKWTYSDGVIDFGDIYINTNQGHLEPLTKYYFDLSDIEINGHKLPLELYYCREMFAFTTSNAVVLFGEHTFNFNNHKDNFVALGEKDTYHITKEMYDNEIEPYSYFKERTVKKWLNKNKWGGSCFGMSASMLMANSQKISCPLPGRFENPVKTANTPYGSRDIINYFHIIQDWYDMNGGWNNKLNMLEILEYAKKIKNIDDIFEMSFYYYEERDGKEIKFGHSVVVLGTNSDEKGTYLYICNPNNAECIEKWYIYVSKSELDNHVYFLNGSELTPAFEIRYMFQGDIDFYSPEKIDNNTYFWAFLNDSMSISTGQGSVLLNKDTTHTGTLIPSEVRHTLYGETNPELMVVLPKDNYYEVSCDDNMLDYSVANNSMFFAAKSDNAEKSVVSAEDGIQLIGSKGNFELTVSTKNMPYDMFDISGVSNGDVDCKYIDNGVKVNLDNTSDTTVTFYNGLDTVDYTVPEKYDDFIIGEENNEESIFIDKDDDGIYETDILTNDDHIHDLSSEYSFDKVGHWHVCSKCDDKVDYTPHTEASKTTVEPTISSKGEKTYYCSVCDYVMRIEEIPPITHIHDLSSTYSSDKSGHWYDCSKCDEKVDFAAHTEDKGTITLEATETTDGIMTYKCSVCGYVMRTKTIPAGHKHKFGTDWKTDSANHWHECTCGEKSDLGAHTEDKGTVTVQPTATTSGTKTYSCIVCGYAMRTETLPAAGYNPYPSAPTYPVVSPVPITSENEIEVTLESDLSGISTGKVHFSTKKRFFKNSAVVTVSNTETANNAASMAISYLSGGAEHNIIYPFDISIYNADTYEKMQLRERGYITFEIPVPDILSSKTDEIGVYHIVDGKPEAIKSRIVEKGGVSKIRFTAESFSPYMFAAYSENGMEDVSSGADVTANSIPIDFAEPTTNGVGMPSARLPQIMKFSNKKRKYCILRKRRLDDLVFVL